MVGLCGVVGPRNHDGNEMVSDLTWTGDEVREEFADDSLRIVGVFHEEAAEDQPATVADGDVLVWVWGDLYGFERDGSYTPKDPGEGAAAYCARLYEDYGDSFVSGLNGDFFGLTYDRAEETVSFFTDRFGMRDAYYARPRENTLVFSTHIQSLLLYPAVTPAFHPTYVREYLTRRRVPGTKTPLRGVRQFLPGGVTTFDPDRGRLTAERFWTVQYSPVDEPFSTFVTSLAERFRSAVAERTAKDGSYGLLLSGGLDSRLHLAALSTLDGVDVTAYHMAEWPSREARTAEQVAEAAGVNLEFLHRDEFYLERGLTRNPGLLNFIGAYMQAHADGFADRLRDEVDYVLDNNFGNSILQGLRIPTQERSLGSIGTLELPILDAAESIQELGDDWARPTPAYVSGMESDREIFAAEVQRDSKGVRYFGLPYDSLETLDLWGGVFPRTHGNSISTVHSLRHRFPYRNPFVDNRVADVALSMPIRYHLRRNIVDETIERLNPELAELPHSQDFVPIKYPFWAQFAGNKPFQLLRLLGLGESEPPRYYQSNSSWPDKQAVARHQDFVVETLFERRADIRQLPFLDWEGVLDCYRDTVAGDWDDTGVNNPKRNLFTLLTLLEMPATRRILAAMDEMSDRCNGRDGRRVNRRSD